MKAYLAARYDRLDELASYANQLESIGVEVTARWLNGQHNAPIGDEAEFAFSQRMATEDLEDVLAADIVISFTEPPDLGPARGGRHVEFGAAYMAGKYCFVVGYRENIFHFLPLVFYNPDWLTCFKTVALIALAERAYVS